MDLGPQQVHDGDGVTHCLSGCGESLDGKREGARYCSDACRTRHWKQAQVSPEERRKRAQRASKRTARARGVIPSDVRVSFRKAVSVLSAQIQVEKRVPEIVARREAHYLLSQALPERLREVEQDAA